MGSAPAGVGTFEEVVRAMMGPADSLTCREIVARSTDYLDAALDRRLCARFETHLAHCAGCQIFLAQMRTTIALVGQLGGEPVSAEARERVLRHVRARQLHEPDR